MTDVVDKIESIRTRNNGAWMALLRIALKHAPTETRIILRVILENDRKVCAQMERLLDE